MLKELVTQWNEAFKNRKEVNKYICDNQSTRRQCVFSFRDTEITSNELWSKGGKLIRISIYVPSTGKFINPKYTGPNNMHWTTVAGVLKGVSIGTVDEDRFKTHRRLWIAHKIPEICNTATKRLVDTGRYKQEEVNLIIDVVKHHIATDNIYIAYLITDIFVEYAKNITGAGDVSKFHGGRNMYIDKLYGLLVNVLNRRFISNGVATISIKDVRYLFKKVVKSESIPPVYAHLRGLVSEIYDRCESSSNFMYVVDALCAYYATITCIPQDIKYAEVLQREHAAKLKKERLNTVRESIGPIGSIGDAPGSSILDKLSLKK